GVIGGADFSLQSLEALFQQDLNGDGTIGVVNNVVEAFGATRLVGRGNAFAAWDATDSGPMLTYLGNPVTDGGFGPWKPIAVEKVGGGYDLAWKNGGLDQYTFWQLDGSGNYTSSLTGVVSGADPMLLNLESSFQQDLNGDGHIGTPPPSLSIAAVD